VRGLGAGGVNSVLTEDTYRGGSRGGFGQVRATEPEGSGVCGITKEPSGTPPARLSPGCCPGEGARPCPRGRPQGRGEGGPGSSAGINESPLPEAAIPMKMGQPQDPPKSEREQTGGGGMAVFGIQEAGAIGGGGAARARLRLAWPYSWPGPRSQRIYVVGGSGYTVYRMADRASAGY